MGDAWDGRPMHPERGGWHWLQAGDSPFIAHYRDGEWREPVSWTRIQAPGRYNYLGPCLLPAEVSAREAAAAAAMREAADDAAHDAIHDAVEEMNECSRVKAAVSSAIAALPLPSGDALAEALAKARREGIEAAIARIAALADAARREGAVIAPDGLDALVAHLRALLEDAR